MIESIFIISIFLNEFLALLYTSERLILYDIISKKGKEDLNKKERRVLINLVFRFFFGIVGSGFLIYGLFVPHLLLYCLLTIALSMITGILNYLLSKRGNSLRERIWLSRCDAIFTMLIWLTPVLEIIKMVM